MVVNASARGVSIRSVVSQDTLSRSSPRGAPRDARVAGTPLRGPRVRPWIPALVGMSGVCRAIGSVSLKLSYYRGGTSA